MRSFIFIFLFSSLALAQRPTDYVNVLSRVSSDDSGNFVLDFDRRSPDLKTGNKIENHVRLIDNDGIATLAALQVALVSTIHAAKRENNISMNSEIDGVLTPQEQLAVMVQKEAFIKLVSVLQGFVDKGQGNYPVSNAPGALTVSDALSKAKQFVARHNIRMKMTMRDLEKQGNFIASIVPAGGKYTAYYSVGDKPATEVTDIKLKDLENPRMDFLNGTVGGGELLPSYFIEGPGGANRSRVVLNGNYAGIADYFESRNNNSQNQLRTH
jgi:hypothetical protein